MTTTITIQNSSASSPIFTKECCQNLLCPKTQSHLMPPVSGMLSLYAPLNCLFNVEDTTNQVSKLTDHPILISKLSLSRKCISLSEKKRKRGERQKELEKKKVLRPYLTRLYYHHH